MVQCTCFKVKQQGLNTLGGGAFSPDFLSNPFLAVFRGNHGWGVGSLFLRRPGGVDLFWVGAHAFP